MSLLRAAALLGRTGLVVGQGALPAQLGALTALQHKLTGCLSHQHPAGWLQARGFATAGSGGSGSGSDQQQQGASQEQQAAAAAAGDGAKDATEQPAEQNATSQQADGQQPQPEEQAAAGQAAPPSKEAAAGQAAPPSKEAAAAESSNGAGTSDSQQPSSSQSIEQDPRLAKFVEGLKQLKGSSTVQRQTVGGDSPWWITLLSTWVGPIVQNWIADFVKAKIEQQFDTEEFLEGAADAFTVVNELIAEGDWDTLRPMMSAKMYTALKDTDDAYKADGLVWRTELSGAPKVELRGMGFMFKDQMRQYDEEIAKLGPDTVVPAAMPGGAWIVLTVQFKCEQNTIITRAEDGQVVAELKDLRPQRWKFASGPLPTGLPVSRLESEWFLLTI
ncbi:hypothetical protein C2E21_3605 [Chlorella sorokiniana]|uniref:Tim44-like domain-containing protein n=1 Tax=Chlorella sorokiniana TaxID=3076 RepID=A0A2P6TU73_CHLSO|nr:hypothetical protein C2E21_3605 [Chlorella sorokiniana]|eukprot:PRW57611.1 hypothetical protein C2E21_3605 [Chlorella sorokiniana]